MKKHTTTKWNGKKVSPTLVEVCFAKGIAKTFENKNLY